MAGPGQRRGSLSAGVAYLSGNACLGPGIKGLSGERQMGVHGTGSQVWLRSADALIQVKPLLQLSKALSGNVEDVRELST